MHRQGDDSKIDEPKQHRNEYVALSSHQVQPLAALKVVGDGRMPLKDCRAKGTRLGPFRQ